MTNIYLPDEIWKLMRDEMADQLDPLHGNEPEFLEQARAEASLRLANDGFCPASLRDQIEAEAVAA